MPAHMSSRQGGSRSWGSSAVVASILSWTALILLIGVAATRPQGASEEGCLDVCLAPALWFVLFVLLTPVVIITALVGAGAGWVAKSREPTGLGRIAWISSLAALLTLVVTWTVMIATGPHS
jgi:hypothetical protein